MQDMDGVHCVAQLFHEKKYCTHEGGGRQTALHARLAGLQADVVHICTRASSKLHGEPSEVNGIEAKYKICHVPLTAIHYSTLTQSGL